MKRKKKFTFIFAIVLILTAFVTPVFASSSRYSFNMRQRVVDGKRNGQFHNLNSGTAHISGSHHIYESVYINAEKQDLHFTLYKNQFGFDKEIGTIVVKNNTSFTGNFGKVQEGKYYLKIWKASRDWHYTMGSGSVSN
ncbi:hypothetical protein ACQRBK_08050 [Peptoniphilaceae bacterium SGI.137]|nr:hypothetical protein [Peptoniphilaceae bacterium]MCI6660195.1 hypothetical protein [Peptoniphilaceae bacterium]MDD7543486.1 hypothetical protein [Peptoniphilaceae bacterium]MDY3987248.1 hypothetical protein [Peptoniphilaceae bacterium]MDY4195659.1 hypothetical protein [Peptoniphilaceae bacterium]